MSSSSHLEWGISCYGSRPCMHRITRHPSSQHSSFEFSFAQGKPTSILCEIFSCSIEGAWNCAGICEYSDTELRINPNDWVCDHGKQAEIILKRSIMYEDIRHQTSVIVYSVLYQNKHVFKKNTQIKLYGFWSSFDTDIGCSSCLVL